MSGPGLPAPAAGEVSALLAAAGDALVDPRPLIQLVPSDDDCAPLSKHKAVGISKETATDGATTAWMIGVIA